ncbi:MAG: hypothetical protein R2824_21155 [Saprospiraceae bacterium]|nr:hypothetical protein [Lewinella sp.]
MHSKYLFPLFLLALTMSPSCYYDVEEELYPSTECNTSGVTYTGVIAAVVQNSCISCHNQSVTNGGVNLDGYNNIKVVANNGRLLGAIRHDNGFAAMPQGQPQLPDCTIQKFEAWVNEGAPEN